MADPDQEFDPIAQAGNMPLYIFMLMYLGVLCSVGFIAKKWKESASAEAGEVKGHFGGEYSVVLVMLTTFSSIFSGYTVVGVPTEARASGFYSSRWVPAILCLALSMVVFFPRLRRLAKMRGYASPSDFIADRYRSKTLTFLGTLSTCLPQLFYLCVQLVSFSGLLNGLTAGAIPNLWGMILFCVIVLALEKIGGMNSVVLADAVQAILMVFGFIMIFLVVGFKYGFMHQLAAANCSTYGIVNMTAKELFRASEDMLDDIPPRCDAISNDCQAYGCIPAVADLFSSGGKPAFFWFIFNFIAFPLNPHMIQRTMIAKADDALRVTSQSVGGAAFLTMIPGIVVGITATVMSPAWPLSSSDAGALAAVQNELKKDGPFQYGLVAVLTCASLAAIMSTADSVILGVANAVSIDIYKGVLRPDASGDAVVHFGNVIAILFTATAFAMGVAVTSDSFGALLSLQNGLILQIVPSFLAGLFFERVSTSALLTGLIAGLISVPIMFFVAPDHPVGVEILAYVPAANFCALVNFFTFIALQFRCRFLPETSTEPSGIFAESVRERFGERLTLAQIQEYMVKDVEPNRMLLALGWVLLLVSFPWSYDISLTEVTKYGFPSWTIYTLGFGVLAAGAQFASLAAWKPNPPPAKVIDSSNVQMAALRKSLSKSSASGLL